ncbi:MAG: rhodanese-like domain-containing protein [Thermodesulfovibrionales bacterium]
MKRLVVAVFFLLCSSVFAQNFPTVTTQEMKSLAAGKTQVAIVDARTSQEYRQGHLPKAVNVPPERVSSIETLLPKNKKVVLVFYCRGYT